jgi:hypothetical protein
MKTEGHRLLAAWMAEDASRSRRYIAEVCGCSAQAVHQWLDPRRYSDPAGTYQRKLRVLAGIPEEAWDKPARNGRAA